MESLNNDIENNRRLAAIEESINRELLYDDNKRDDKKCLETPISTFIYVSLVFGIIILIMVIIIISKII